MKPTIRNLAIILFIAVFSYTAPGISIAANDVGNRINSSQEMFQIKRGVSPALLANLSNTEMVQLPSGRTMNMGKLRKFSAMSKQLKKVKNLPRQTGLKYQPAATGIRVNNSADLSAVLQRPENETVQLPSGKLVTVELLRYLQPIIEKRIGRNLAKPSKRKGLSGKPITIKNTTDKQYWKDILLKPDSTVLKAPDGKLITVGELKQSLGGSSPGIRKSSKSSIKTFK